MAVSQKIQYAFKMPAELTLGKERCLPIIAIFDTKENNL